MRRTRTPILEALTGVGRFLVDRPVFKTGETGE